MYVNCKHKKNHNQSGIHTHTYTNNARLSPFLVAFLRYDLINLMFPGRVQFLYVFVCDAFSGRMQFTVPCGNFFASFIFRFFFFLRYYLVCTICLYLYWSCTHIHTSKRHWIVCMLFCIAHKMGFLFICLNWWLLCLYATSHWLSEIANHRLLWFGFVSSQCAVLCSVRCIGLVCACVYVCVY